VNPEIKELPELKVLYSSVNNATKYAVSQPKNIELFDQFRAYMDQHGLWHKTSQYMTIYPNESILNQEMKFDMGSIFLRESDEVITAEEGDYQNFRTVASGLWAVFTHVGKHETILETWRMALHEWLPESGYQLRQAIPFEVYIDDPSVVDADYLSIKIYIPIV